MIQEVILGQATLFFIKECELEPVSTTSMGVFNAGRYCRIMAHCCTMNTDGRFHFTSLLSGQRYAVDYQNIRVFVRPPANGTD